MCVARWWCHLYKMGDFKGKDAEFSLRYAKFEVRCPTGS